ncbi:MAG: sigma-70 family RNA polymerase sigma factor [Proteobacteria bacterium]|nr:sigma-70 family RNA polymerase sigma factor [Pseudomonadota bacterium]MCP4920917.1 sigma-70 family RNA polymerase sigma factor [Pseudomonadota bacterium]
MWPLCRRLSSEPRDDYQAIWEKVFKALPDADGGRPLGPWIGTIARRHLIDRHRRTRVRGDVLELADHAISEPIAPAAIDRKARHALLERALKRLPEAQLRVVVLHHIQGTPLDDLARDEGVAVGTIKSRLHRGRARLAQLLVRHA